jgi:hypothetical protein
VTGLLRYGVWLTAVVGDLGVNEVNDVWSNWRRHDVGKYDGGGLIGGHVTIQGLDGDERTSSGGGHLSRNVSLFSHSPSVLVRFLPESLPAMLLVIPDTPELIILMGAAVH